MKDSKFTLQGKHYPGKKPDKNNTKRTTPYALQDYF